MTIDPFKIVYERSKDYQAVIDFLKKNHLEFDDDVDYTVNCYYSGALVGTASLHKNIIKCAAVDASYQGNGIFNGLITRLIEFLGDKGILDIMVYTKPRNITIFEDLGFKTIEKTADVVLMERGLQGIDAYLESLDKFEGDQACGAIVMNCNPFTKGHQHLIDYASSQCDHIYIFVLSEDRSLFNTDERYEMVRRGTEHLANVRVQQTSDYIISAATFPTYFHKDDPVVANQTLDLQIFSNKIAPKLGITTRFIGREPLCQVTASYNRQMHKVLKANGLLVIEIPRKTYDDVTISASRVRYLIGEQDWKTIRSIVPDTTMEVIERKFGVEIKQ